MNILRRMSKSAVQKTRVEKHFPIQMVPQQMAYVVETFGKFTTVMAPGLNFMIPFAQKVAHALSLKEESHTIPNQSAFTKDNVNVEIDTILYLKVVDPYKTAYGAFNSVDYACKLAESVMRSQIGNLSLDSTFSSREKVNEKVLEALKVATEPWGIECTRHEIKDIRVSQRIKKIMALEAESERIKRAEILASEAKKASILNDAEALKQTTILEAEGEAENKILIARAIAKRVNILKEAGQQTGYEAFDFMVADEYLSSLTGLSHKNILVSANLNSPKDVIDKALGISERPDSVDAQSPK